MSTPLFDPGLQPERTALAWRRTALAIGVGSLIALRVLPEALGSLVWLTPAVLGLMFAGWLWWRADRRYRATARVLAADGDRAALPGGALLAVLLAFVVAAGLLALGVVIAVALGR
ncbi:DUF202 domain-containing protein [Microbacterium aurantiacum]|uniref:DUF202 domain-containing protein n=1 Tax=Microbacterium aurantiacum TaxID=162393 RepID=UPI00343438B6